MTVDRGSGSPRARHTGVAGSKAIALPEGNQTKPVGLPRESAIADLNNARQILSGLYEELDPRAASFSVMPTAEQIRTTLLAAARRLGKVAEKLKSAPDLRACKNCQVPLVENANGHLACIFCGQVEDGEDILVAGAARLELTELGRGVLEIEAIDEELDNGTIDQAEALALIEQQRHRYREMCDDVWPFGESTSSIKGPEQ